ncbi:MAG: tRNA preQ1(34) S-adenosylmethionine ribosyltransferase-isomerase QueA [Myxococcota bacterium]|nr:tRNA preQ1(34) S-adenosylmethionine ribosyltransferase-isomerase QueA [Myxococcota bacterium]
MRVRAFDYELPPELIAQRPLEDRGSARLLHLARYGGVTEHRNVADLPELLPPGALVVLNDTRVLPARLLGRKQHTGGRVEIFLVRRAAIREIETEPGIRRKAEVWRAFGKASKSFKLGADVEVRPRGDPQAPPQVMARALGRADDGLLEVALWTPSGEPLDAALRACGHTPLPPYIKRDDDAIDAERYQTVYARNDGAVAAPTAGLHLSHAALRRIAARGCNAVHVTLHVGLGSFQPVSVDDLDDHPMHVERYEVSQSTADAIADARARGAAVVAIGTTTVRALETVADPTREGHVRPATGETRLLIQPGYAFRVVDAMLTNFHLPRSTLLALVCAFGGMERVLSAYRQAVHGKYRFFSYGDAMMLWRGS